jgi:hypothetical protein
MHHAHTLLGVGVARYTYSHNLNYFFSTTSTNPTSMYCPPPVCLQ